jgi:hypothetical protein
MEFICTGLFKRKGEDESIGHFEKKKVHLNILPILNGYRDRAVWVWGALLFPPFSLMFVRLDKK